MSLIHFLCDSSGSTLTAMTFTFLLANSSLILATVPNSVVHTGVKSAGCEKSTPQPPPSHWWKFTSPSVVCAVKSGAISPNRTAIELTFLFSVVLPPDRLPRFSLPEEIFRFAAINDDNFEVLSLEYQIFSRAYCHEDDHPVLLSDL